MRSHRRLAPLIPFLFAALVASLAGAQAGYKVEASNVPLDGDTKESLRPLVVESGGVTLTKGEGGVVGVFWPVKAVAARQTPVASGDGKALNGIPEGSLLGVLRLRMNGLDAKELPIQSGIYAVRYLIQPNDGNHLGTSQFPDFAALCRMNLDPGGAVADRQELIDIAIGDSGHPSVFFLQPAPEGQSVPSLGRSEMGQLVLYVGINARAPNGDEAEFKIGFVPNGIRAE